MRSVKLALLAASFPLGLLGASAAGAPGTPPSDPFSTYRNAERAAQDIWDKMPMAPRRVAFVNAPVKQFGAYEPRGDNVFKRTETVFTYIEPAGFVFRDVGDGVMAYGFRVDLLMKTASGRVSMDKHDYATLDSRTRSRREEVEFSSALDLKNIGPGTYGLEFTFHDLNSDKTMVVKQTFKLVE